MDTHRKSRVSSVDHFIRETNLVIEPCGKIDPAYGINQLPR